MRPPLSAAKTGEVSSPLRCIVSEKAVLSGDSSGIEGASVHISSDHDPAYREASGKSSGLDLKNDPDDIHESDEFSSADEYDSRSDTETQQNDSYLGESPEEIIRRIFSILKDEMVACVMRDIYGMLNPNGNLGIRSHAGGTESPNSTPLALIPGESSGRRCRKRGLDGEGSSGSDDGQEDDRGKRPRQRDNPLRSQVESCRFACPFYKHDAEKYQTNDVTGQRYRTCPGPGFESVHRVK